MATDGSSKASWGVFLTAAKDVALVRVWMSKKESEVCMS